jgi:hypothetical protein
MQILAKINLKSSQDSIENNKKKISKDYFSSIKFQEMNIRNHLVHSSWILQTEWYKEPNKYTVLAEIDRGPEALSSDHPPGTWTTPGRTINRKNKSKHQYTFEKMLKFISNHGNAN